MRKRSTANLELYKLKQKIKRDNKQRAIIKCMELLGINAIANGAKVSTASWFGLVLKRKVCNILKVALGRKIDKHKRDQTAHGRDEEYRSSKIRISLLTR